MLLMLNLPPFTSIHEFDRRKWDGWLTHVIHRIPVEVVAGGEFQENYLARSVPSYRAWRFINRYLPASACVLTFSDGDHFYSTRERIWANATMARPAVWGAARGEERQALQALRKLGVSHVLFDKKLIKSLEPGTLAIAQPSVLTSSFRFKYEDKRFILYELLSED